MSLGVALFFMSISVGFSANYPYLLPMGCNESPSAIHYLNPKFTGNSHDLTIRDKAILTAVSAQNKTFPKSKAGYINNLALLIVVIVLLFLFSLKPKSNLLKNWIDKQKLGALHLNSMRLEPTQTKPSDIIQPFKPDDSLTHLENVLAKGCKTLHCDVGLIVVLDHPNDQVEITHIFSHQPTQLLSKPVIDLKHTIFNDIYQDNVAVKSENLPNSVKTHIKDIEVTAYIGTKLFVDHCFYGLLCFIKSEPNTHFTAHDLDSFMLTTYWIADLLESESTIKRLEAEKEHATKTTSAKSSFLANMSHEIRTPLTVITGYSEMLLEDIHEGSTDQCIDDIHKIQKASKHLLKVINDILDLSKIEAGKIEVYLDSSDIGFLVNDILQFCQPLAAKNNNRINFESPNTTINITTDSTLLRQCVLNLIANACKFTKNGDISITVSKQNIPIIGDTNVNPYVNPYAIPYADNECTWIYISVTDTGIGISEKSLGSLFKDFSQVDNVNPANYGGSGLGLAISDRMCRLLGGEISVESELNKGSTFTIKIPDLTNTHKNSV